MRLRFGLGAWSNKHFDHALYPIRTLHAEYLPRYASVFDVAEADRLYHFPAEAQELYAWADSVPESFTFLPKLHKTVVAEHKDDAALQRAKEHLASYAPLGDKQGPVLAQFPPGFGYTRDDLDWLDRLLGLAPRGAMSVELRHASWWRDDVRDVLERRRAPLVWSTHRKGEVPDWATGDWGHVRFVGPHHDTRGRHPTVDDRLEDILQMRARLAGAPWDLCHVIVTNGFEGNAVDSLPRIAAALGDEALAKRCTRKPGEVLFPDPMPAGQARLHRF